MNCAQRDAVSAIHRRWNRVPRIGMILGTGLGSVTEAMEVEAELPYQAIPHFPRPTAIGHDGHLVCGQLADLDVVAMRGRCHFYEGYSMEELALPVQVMAVMGAGVLLVSNAAGGLNPQYKPGELMVVCDHVNLMGSRTVRQGDPLLVPRRSQSTYDESLIERATAIARRRHIILHRGVYVGVVGPNYETRAEYRALRRLGGDAVGMSTVPEVLAAIDCGLKTLAISTITNVAAPDAPLANHAQHVVDVAESSEPRLRQLVMELLGELSSALKH